MMSVAACGGLFAIMDVVGALWSAVLAWFMILVAVHVAANVWGSRFHNNRQKRANTDLPSAGEQRTHSCEAPLTFAPSTRLRHGATLGRKMLVASAAGALAGGALGSYLLWLANWERLGYAGLAVGGLSAAVIGGFLGFLTSSFVEVAGQAWDEATRSVTPGANQSER